MKVKFVTRNSAADIAIVACPALCHNRLVIWTRGSATSVLRDLIVGKRLTIRHDKYSVEEIQAKMTSQETEVPFGSVKSADYPGYLSLRSTVSFRTGSISKKRPVDGFGAIWQDIV